MTKKNILFFTALKANDPNMHDYMEWSLKTWRYYAKKYNCELFILEDPLYDTEYTPIGRVVYNIEALKKLLEISEILTS